ncbi:MAG: YihY/virulence factor BrkB family protein [Ignavibacteriae bacterium]|nr:YihY/virulence factor BrkB family protein [Ignavibacteriota bacterium]MCB9205841.1 YihY/virulence factor BrkB family protein [Ignavibacteriales bacterium]MCB9219275.1 YihY/virulence factor BrkB family protein [Ignavibacteriales bacterium]MCB9260161.1 YihY/virulence factor BrkB family protein [Ignavibacteriales bacterium]
MKKIITFIQNVIKFITKDIWRIRLNELTGKKAFLIKLQRILFLTIRNFRDDNCTLRASALTFYSMLSIVPIVAILFGIFKGFGLQNQLEKALIENFKDYEAVMIQVVNYSNILLENTKGGVIAGIGIVLLLWTVIKLLNNIEYSLNDIWKIKNSRTVIRQFSDFLAILFLAPLFFVLASGLTVFISVYIDKLISQFEILGTIAPLISFALKFLPYLFMWILFTMIYVIMPNGPVKISAGFSAAVVAGTIYQIVQFIYVEFQIGIANYNAIYGSFAVFPLFLIWLQTSWLIFLFGAEISYSVQNIVNHEFEADSKNINISQKRLISLAIAKLVAKNFQKGNNPITSEEIAHNLGVPIVLTKNLIREFIDTGLFSKIYDEKLKINYFQPAKDIKLFTVKYVIDALENKGSEIPLTKSENFDSLSEISKSMSKILSESSENKLLVDI